MKKIIKVAAISTAVVSATAIVGILLLCKYQQGLFGCGVFK
jgi:hypothetical protein